MGTNPTIKEDGMTKPIDEMTEAEKKAEILQLRAELTDASTHHTDAWYVMGRCIDRLVDLKDNVPEIVAAAKMTRANAMSIRRVYRFCRDCKINEKDRKALGMTRLLIMQKYLDTNRVAEWIDKAKGIACNTLSEMLRQTPITTGALTFRLNDQQHATVDHALVLAGAFKKGGQMHNKDVALMAMAELFIEKHESNVVKFG